jgi:hypothetical protein
MTYLSARQRRELVLLPSIVYGVAWHLLSDGPKDQAKVDVDPAFRTRVLDLLGDAMLEPVRDLPRDEQIKALTRLRPLRLWLLEPWEHRTDIAEAMIGVHELIRLLTEAQYLEIVEGSSFALAWDELTEAVDEQELNTLRFTRFEAGGRAMGREMLRRLQSRNLFRHPALLALAEAA